MPGDIILFGSAEDEIQAVGIYIRDDEFMHVTSTENKSDIRIHTLSDQEWDTFGRFSYRAGIRYGNPQKEPLDKTSPEKIESNESQEEVQIDVAKEIDKEQIDTAVHPAPVLTAFLDEQFECYYFNEQQIPFVISPKDSNLTLASFQAWVEVHQHEFKALIERDGALLLRNFPVETAEEFGSVLKSVLGRNLLDYRGGEGSRRKVAEGVYTSTEAPAQFKIPLHNELSCSNYAPDYICFYCDIAPAPGSGQTILGKTEAITQDILLHPDIWNFFNGRNIRYISRHPPAGSFFSKVNVTHKTWQAAFETNDKEEVERICQARGFEYKWIGDWIEVTRIVPAIRGPDAYFDHPYWFNQAHLYHGNPRIRGGWLNHMLANLLYIAPHTSQYDVLLEDGTPIPNEIIYAIYDILDANTIKFDWNKGDVLIVDNRRGLHGRAPYTGERRILASMAP